jgi:hypothetical protein
MTVHMLKPSAGMVWLFLIAVAGTVALIASSTGFDRIRALHSGPLNLTIAFYACLMLAIVFVFGARWAVVQSGDIQEAQAKTEQQQRAQVVEDQLAEVVAELARLGERVERTQLEAGRIALSTTTASRIGPLEASSTHVRVVSSDGRPQLALVFHLFPNSAYWRFDSAVAFEDPSGQPLDFLGVIHDRSVQDELNDFDYLVGLGLASNSPNSEEALSLRRAATLCGVLFGARRAAGAPRSMGLSLGVYQGPAQDTHARPERRQRSVVIVGIDRLAQNVSAEDLLVEVLRQVALPGIDLRIYSELSEGRGPRWLETDRCERI